MSVFDDLQKQHENLSKRLHDNEDVLNDVRKYIELARHAGKEITDVQDRDQMRANLRYWAGYVFEREKVYPNVDLESGSTVIGSRRLWSTYLIAIIAIVVIIFAIKISLPTPISSPISLPTRISTPILSNVVIYDRTLAPGYSLNIDNSSHTNGWISSNDENFRFDFLSDQTWAVGYITFGKSEPPGQRDKSLNISSCFDLSVDLRATQENVEVYIGMKDTQDPDDGSETRLPITVSTTLHNYSIPLSKFATADLRQIYIPFEIVYLERNSATIFIDNVILKCQQ